VVPRVWWYSDKWGQFCVSPSSCAAPFTAPAPVSHATCQCRFRDSRAIALSQCTFPHTQVTPHSHVIASAPPCSMLMPIHRQYSCLHRVDHLINPLIHFTCILPLIHMLATTRQMERIQGGGGIKWRDMRARMIMW